MPSDQNTDREESVEAGGCDWWAGSTSLSDRSPEVVVTLVTLLRERARRRSTDLYSGPIGSAGPGLERDRPAVDALNGSVRSI